MRIYLPLVLGSFLLLSANELCAHHSFAAEFDAAKPFSLTGTVTKVVWANPHAWLYVDVVDAQKKTTNKDGSPTGNARSVVTSAGEKLFAGSSQDATP
jgi:hypothetical protein